MRDEQIQAAVELTQYVETEGRDLPLDTLDVIFQELTRKLLDMINSGDTREVLGGICAMDRLIGIKTGKNNDSHIGQFASTFTRNQNSLQFASTLKRLFERYTKVVGLS